MRTGHVLENDKGVSTGDGTVQELRDDEREEERALKHVRWYRLDA